MVTNTTNPNKFRATINGLNLRDRGTKLLLTNISTMDKKLVRDHCWVEITDELRRKLPKHHLVKMVIIFTADVKEYKSKYIDKVTLCNISNITVAKLHYKRVKKDN